MPCIFYQKIFILIYVAGFPKKTSHHSASAWQRVNFHGKLNRQEVNEVLAKSSIGLCTLHPTPAYLNSLPIKMFEYMAFGLPVVVSNFPYWIEIINKARCGTAADPLDSRDIAKKISLILESKEIYSNYSKMGYLRLEINLTGILRQGN